MSLTRWSLLGCLLVGEGFYAQPQPNTVLGKGWGLDHVIVAQKSTEDARRTFGQKLGFSLLPGSKFPDQALENGPILLPPGYLELMWIYDAEKADSIAKAAGASGLFDVMKRRVEEQGGNIMSYNIDVSSAEEAASFLRTLGMKVTLPRSVTTLRDGKEQPGQWQFLSIEYGNGKGTPPAGVPGGPGVGFLEYLNNTDHLTEDWFRRTLERIEREAPDPRRKPGDLHANTAKKLESVWVAVSSVQQAVKQAESLGLAQGRERTISELGARGREVQCGQGTVLFLEAASEDGPFSNMVKHNGLGPFGVSIGVTDLNRAHEIVEKGTGKSLPIDKTEGRSRFRVPAEAASGVWIEFVQE